MLGNWIDLIIIFYLLIHFVDGTRRGFFSILIVMFSFILALILAFLTYSYSADFFINNFAINLVYANVLGFFINIFIFKLSLIIIFFKILPKIFNEIKNNLLNKIIGGLVSVAYGATIVFILLSITLSFPLPHLMSNELSASTAGNFVENDPLKINNKFKNIFGEVLKTTISKLDFLTIETGDEEKIELDFQVSDLKFNEKMEVDMLEMVNRERTSRGLGELVADEKARLVAREYGKDMFEKGYFAHLGLDGRTAFDRMEDGGVEFNLAGENLALSKDLLSAHQGLMDSHGHKKNILNPFFHRVGIGVIDGGIYGFIFVQNFAD